jgi:hypothetical protein
MKIELLGDDCRKCRLMKSNILQALRNGGEKVEFQHVCEPGKFAEYGLLSLPGFAIDGELKAEGRLLSVETILRMILNKR